MRTLLGTLIVIIGYIVIYYRLLVRHFYEQQYNVKESTFGALFSLPPYRRLDARGKKYALRYWVAVAALLACLAAVAVISDASAIRPLSG